MPTKNSTSARPKSKLTGTKATTAKRSLNASGKNATKKNFKQNPHSPNSQDPKRRLGAFGGAGEHPRTGNRGHR